LICERTSITDEGLNWSLLRDAVDPSTIGRALMKGPAPHGGERHIDGDELLYLASGSVSVSLDHEEKEVLERHNRN
jgi:hypothetical protein